MTKRPPVVAATAVDPTPGPAPETPKPSSPKGQRTPHDQNVTWSIAALIAAPPISAVFFFGIGYPPGSETARAVFAVALPLVVTLVSLWRVARRRRPDRPGAVKFARLLMLLDVAVAGAGAWYVLSRVL